MDKQRTAKEDLEKKSLVPFTEIQDVKLINLSANAPEEFHANLDVQTRVGNPEFRAQEGKLQVKISAKVTYSPIGTTETPTDGVLDEADDDTPGNESIAGISMTYSVDLDLDPSIDPLDLDADIVSIFVERNLIFMVYPYVRATVQRVTGEMPFPPTVLPYMRR